MDLELLIQKIVTCFVKIKFDIRVGDFNFFIIFFSKVNSIFISILKGKLIRPEAVK